MAIIGAGPAGCAVGLTLARLGASVLCVAREGGHAIRGEMLPPKALQPLHDLHVAQRVLRTEHLPMFGTRSTWGSDTAHEYDFVRSPFGSGQLIDRVRFDRMLQNELRHAGGEVREVSRVATRRSKSDGGWVVELLHGSGERHMQAEFVVDASGRARVHARAQGVRRRAYDRLVGVVGVYTVPGADLRRRAVIDVHAARDGWWYVSPHAGSRFVTGYMTDADLAPVSRMRDLTGWLQRMQETFVVWARVQENGGQLCGKLRTYAADSSRLETPIGPGWCAVGDAAVAHDPLSSQGITSALLGGMVAGRLIGEQRAGALLEYAEWVRERYAAYRARHLAYYAQEGRWPDSTFWRRRHDALQVLLHDAPIGLHALT